MDIEFIVQDVFALTRPQWKLASNLEEASRAFQLAMAQDQKTSGIDKAVEPDEPESDASSDDGVGDNDPETGLPEADADEDSESDEDVDVSDVLSPLAVLIVLIDGSDRSQWRSHALCTRYRLGG
jgi:regulator of nonsense transcripts 2